MPALCKHGSTDVRGSVVAMSEHFEPVWVFTLYNDEKVKPFRGYRFNFTDDAGNSFSMFVYKRSDRHWIISCPLTGRYICKGYTRKEARHNFMRFYRNTYTHYIMSYSKVPELEKAFQKAMDEYMQGGEQC